MIQKITQSELAETSIASLPTRPSLPSLYSGRSLSAKELREAFDQLPHLLAERFNALIESLGLYKEGEAIDSFAEALATGLREGHSLADLFADLQSGALCEYMNADGERTLAQVLTSLSERLDEGIRYVVQTVGTGDIVSSVEGIDGDIFVRRTVNSKSFAKSDEVAVMKDALAAAEKNHASAESVKHMHTHLSNIEKLLYPNILAYENDEGLARGSIVPANAFPYAALDKLGGSTLFASEPDILCGNFVSVAHTPSDASYTGTVTQNGSDITFKGRFDYYNLKIVLLETSLMPGRYSLSPLGVSGLTYTMYMELTDGSIKNELLSESGQEVPFLYPENAINLRLEILAYENNINGTVTPTLHRQLFSKSPVHSIKVTEKNLLPDTVHQGSCWLRRFEMDSDGFLDYYFDEYVPKAGKYTLSLSYNPDTWNTRVLLLERSLDGGNTWICAEGDVSPHIIGEKICKVPKVIEVREGEKWRLSCSPPLSDTVMLLSHIQLEVGEKATDFEEYFEKIYPLPQEITSLADYGCAYGTEERYSNYVDFENKVFVKNVVFRKYDPANMDATVLETDMYQTIHTCKEEKIPLSQESCEFALLPVYAGGAVFFINNHNSAVRYAITYQSEAVKGEKA